MLNLVKETRKLGCKPTHTPIEPNHRLGEENEGAAVDRGNYQRLVSKLISLSH